METPAKKKKATSAPSQDAETKGGAASPTEDVQCKGADVNDLRHLDQLTVEAAKQGRFGGGRLFSNTKEYYKYQAYLQHALEDSDDDPFGTNAAHSQLQAAAIKHAKKMKGDLPMNIPELTDPPGPQPVVEDGILRGHVWTFNGLIRGNFRAAAADQDFDPTDYGAPIEPMD